LNKPNILFFFTDDQRFDTINALGNEKINTPHIDWLVENGTTFSDAYIMGGTNYAVCMPSRAMLMTGRTLFHLEDTGSYIPQEHVMLGETLQSEGYTSWGCGKWHNGVAAYARNFNDGSDVYFGGMYDHWTVPVHTFDPTGKYEGRITRTASYRPSNLVEEKIANHVPSGIHSTDLFASQAAEFIKTYDKDDPFFAYVAFMAPHDPRSMPQEFLDMYDPKDIEIGDSFMEMHPFDNGSLTVRDELIASFPRSESDIRHHVAEYYAMITHIDTEIGKVIDVLRETGQLDNTIIAFAGDNGLALGRHGLMGKQSLYEHSIHIPMILSGPGIPKNNVTKARVYTVDFYPTLCELAGIEIPSTVMGHSLAPVLRGELETTRNYHYFVYKEFIRAVNVNGMKLIEYNVNGKRTTQLFDIDKDPMETNDLSKEPSSSKLIDVLREKLLEGKKEYGDNIAPYSSFWEGF